MEENQNGMYGGEAPRTYGEESKMYENQEKQAASQSYEQANPYSQSYGQSSQPYNQPNQPYGANQQYGTNNQAASQLYGASQQYNQPNQPYGAPTYRQPYGNANQNYGQMNQPYGAPVYQQPYGNGFVSHAPVKDIFCNILLVIRPIRAILSTIMALMIYSSMGSYEDIMSGKYFSTLTNGPYSILSMFSSLLMIAYIVFVVLDIVAVNKGNYKILGLIMFALFLDPAYYIWRAYVLKRKKTVPVIYTVGYVILLIACFVIMFSYLMNIWLDMAGTMY